MLYFFVVLLALGLFIFFSFQKEKGIHYTIARSVLGILLFLRGITNANGSGEFLSSDFFWNLLCLVFIVYFFVQLVRDVLKWKRWRLTQ